MILRFQLSDPASLSSHTEREKLVRGHDTLTSFVTEVAFGRGFPTPCVRRDFAEKAEIF